MLIYFVLLAVVTFLALAATRTKRRRVSRTLYALILAALVLVPSCRSHYVGTDAGYYVRFFNQARTLGEVAQQRLEPGYFFLSWLAHAISDNYMAIFFLVALVVAACFVRTIRRWSPVPAMSFFVLLVSGAYFVSFVGARQGLANAVFFLGIGAMFRRKLWLYLLCVAVACSFHMTAIVTLPAYFLVTRKGGARANLLIGALAAFGIVFFDQLVSLGSTVEERFAVYGRTVTQGKGLLVLAFICTLCTIFLFYRKYVVQYRPMYDVLLNMYVLGTAICFVTAWQGTSASGIRRLSLYFTLSEILLWPIVLKNMRERKQKRFFLGVFVSLYLIYYGLTLNTFGNLVPFRFNPVIAQWFGS